MRFHLRTFVLALIVGLAMMYPIKGWDLGNRLVGLDTYRVELVASSEVEARLSSEFVYQDRLVKKDVGNRHKKYHRDDSETAVIEARAKKKSLWFNLPTNRKVNKLRWQVETDLPRKYKKKDELVAIKVHAMRFWKNNEVVLEFKGKNLRNNLQNNKGLFRPKKVEFPIQYFFQRESATLALKKEFPKYPVLKAIQPQSEPFWVYVFILIGTIAALYFVLLRFPKLRKEELSFQNWSLGVIFISFLFFSLLQIRYPVFEVENTEKRDLYAVPSFTLDHVYFKKLKLYFQENFGFRNHFIRLNNLTKYYLFGVSPVPDKVVVGKDGWLYKKQLVRDLTVTKPLSEKQLKTITKRVKKMHKKLRKMGIKYYIMLPTEKAILYPEMLPGKLEVQNSIRRQVSEAIQERTRVPVIDTEEILRANLDTFLYYKYDFHWNEIAGFLAYLELMKVLSADFPQMRAKSWEDMEVVESQSLIKGLSYTIALHNELDEMTPLVDPISGKQWNQKKRIKGAPKGTQVTMVDNPRLPSAVVVHDSFFATVKKHLADHFSSAIYIQNEAKAENPNIEFQFIEKRKPDMVIHEFMIHTDYNLNTIFGK